VAALRVLEAAGFDPVLPGGDVCCGLTWFTTGQLEGARKVVRKTLEAPGLDGEEPVLVLEPSCAAMLRRDLPELLPDERRAASVARRVVTLAELLERVGWAPPAPPPDTGRPQPQRTVVQPHCHQQSVLGFDADRRLLRAAGVEPAPELAGCCGLAGSFGAEAGHETVSLAVAELALLPALRTAGPAAPVVADGFSCRTQVSHLDGRRPRHLAEVLAARLPVRPTQDAR
jgi:Fe-S oxidoreductase